MENNNVSMSEMPLAMVPVSTDNFTTVPETTNHSFQNKPPSGDSSAPFPHARSKKRGISVLLQDVTNTGIHKEMRDSAARAKRCMVTKSHVYALRGNPGCKGKVLHTRPVSVSDMRKPGILKNDKRLASDLFKTLGGYIQRNHSFEIQTVLAIHIMVSAVLQWNSTILQAAEHASNCSGFNPKVIRQWASAFVEDASSYTQDEANDDKCITNILASTRGQHAAYDSLCDDKDFCLAACAYVSKHAYRGEPHLTCKMFADWVKTDHKLMIHETTACLWLHQLGFA